MQDDFLTPKSLQEAIMAKVAGGSTYIDSIIEFCDNADMEFEDLTNLLSDNLKQRLREEYVENGYLKEEAQLPL